MQRKKSVFQGMARKKRQTGSLTAGVVTALLITAAVLIIQGQGAWAGLAMTVGVLIALGGLAVIILGAMDDRSTSVANDIKREFATEKTLPFQAERSILEANFTEALIETMTRFPRQSILVVTAGPEAQATKRLMRARPELKISLLDATEPKTLAEVGSYGVILFWLPSDTEIRAHIGFDSIGDTTHLIAGPPGGIWGNDLMKFSLDPLLGIFIGDSDGLASEALLVREPQ